MNSIYASLSAIIPADIDILSMGKFIALTAVCIFMIGLLFRFIFGKGSNLNHAVSSAIAIFFLYVITVIIYTFKPGNLAEFLTPLPYVRFSDTQVYLFPFQDSEFTKCCSQLLSMIILAFLVNLLDSCIPKGKKLLGWFFYRLLGIIMSLVVHYASVWAFNAFLPGALVTFAPVILLILLIGSLLLGIMNVIFSIVLTVVNPIIGALYAFFFSSKFGKQLSKSVLTTVLLTALVALLTHFGYAVINISPNVLGSYIPLVAALMGLWYFIGNIL